MKNETHLHRESELSVSIMSLIDKSTFYTALMPMHGFVDIIKEAGYDGIEWHPLLRIIAAAQLNHGLISQHTKDAITSLHQSWRGEKNIGESLAHPNKAIALVSYLILPERLNSLNDLERIQTILGKQLPVVLYPSRPGEEHGTGRNYGEKLYQPTVEVMQAFGSKSVGNMITRGYELGYTGIALDLFHMREVLEGKTLGRWQDVLPQLLPHAQEIHVAAGRYDGRDKSIDTMQELGDLYHGSGSSDLVEMLKMVEASGWKGRVVVEIPAAAIASVYDKNKVLTPSQIIETHKRIVGNVQQLVF